MKTVSGPSSATMKSLLLLVLTAVAVQAIDWSKVRPLEYYYGVRSPRITDGNIATPHQFPWQAAVILTMSTGQEAFCGGSVISEEWILTAAHCAKDAQSFEIILGAQKVQENEPTQIRIKTTDKIVHEHYSSLLITNDIALIKLPSKITFNENIQPIRLPSQSEEGDNFKGQMATVSGWGKPSDDATSISPVLRFESDEVIGNLICRLQYLINLRDSNICLDGSDGKSTCNGDSGGPLYIQDTDGKPTQIGIVSFGSALGCEKGYHPVFTRVTSYVEWISQKTGIALRP